MAFLARTCLALVCDRCGDGWADVDAEAHFPNAKLALTYAARAGWAVTATRAVCPECRTEEDCALVGHSRGHWSPLGPFPDHRGSGGTWEGRARYCLVCTSGEWDPPVRRHGLDQEAG